MNNRFASVAVVGQDNKICRITFPVDRIDDICPESKHNAANYAESLYEDVTGQVHSKFFRVIATNAAKDSVLMKEVLHEAILSLREEQFRADCFIDPDFDNL